MFDILGLAITQLKRHTPSNQTEDLDKAILNLTKSILLQPRSRLDRGPVVLQALPVLAEVLIQRSGVSKQPEDAIFAAIILRRLRDRPQEAFGFPRHRVTSLLVDALVLQVRSKAGNVMKNIGEMAVLYCELLASDASESDTTRSILPICVAILSEIHPGVPGQPLDQVVECLRAARRHKPDLREARYTLAYSLCIRYCTMTFANDDYEEAMSIYDEIITSSPPGDTLVPVAQDQVTVLAIFRLMMHQTPEDAIFAAINLRRLRDQPQEASAFPRHRVTSLLMDALVLQVRSKAGNVMKNIREMAVLYCELLASDASESDTTRSTLLICEAILSEIRPGVPGQPLDQVVECLRAARRHKPDLREARFTLAYSLCIRYCTMTFANDDYEEAMSIYDEIITSSPPGDTFVPLAQHQVTALAMFRSEIHQTPEYLEEAIYRARAFSSSSPDSVPLILLSMRPCKTPQRIVSITSVP